MKYDYTTELKLKHNEIPAIINTETAELKELTSNQYKKEPKDRSTMYFNDFNQPWSRTFSASWKLLETQTTPKELLVAHKLAIRAKAYTNSLEPLNPESTVRVLAQELQENKNNIDKIIDKLFKLGVIGKFEVYEDNQHHQKYWVFNPFLSFNGKTIKKDVANLFSRTTYAKVVMFG